MTKNNRIGLNIPQQALLKGKPFYMNEKETAEWVERLPLANLGETSRRLFQALQEFNQTAVPYRHRLAATEQFRQPVNYVVSSLKKHYLDVGFPLGDKAHRIAVLNRELHNALATSYKSAVSDIVLADLGKSEHKTLATALHRAVHHLSRMMLMSVLVYDSFPKRNWLELHTLHRLACQYGLETQHIHDPLEASEMDASIDQAYRRVLLFCLAMPYKLRQRVNLQLYDALLDWVVHTRFRPLDAAVTDTTIFIQQDVDAPPCHGTFDIQALSEHQIRLDVGELIRKLREQIEHGPEVDALPGVESMHKNLLRQLIQLWSAEQKRTFMRTRLNFELRVAVGIGNIFQVLKQLNEPLPESQAGADQGPVQGFEILSRFTLTPLEGEAQTEVRRNNFEEFGPNSRDPEAVEPILSIWDDAKEKPRKADTFVFRTLNESAGGYCLKWSGEQIPKILVGELIGIRSSLARQRFGIGLVRWMKRHPHEEMQVGIQMIAPSATTVTAHPSKQPKQPVQDCLLLPEVGTSGQPTSLVCPSFPFKVGDRLTLDQQGQTREIKLTRLLESTGAVSQFQFRQLDGPGSGKDDEEIGGDFEQLWSTL